MCQVKHSHSLRKSRSRLEEFFSIFIGSLPFEYPFLGVTLRIGTLDKNLSTCFLIFMHVKKEARMFVHYAIDITTKRYKKPLINRLLNIFTNGNRCPGAECAWGAKFHLKTKICRILFVIAYPPQRISRIIQSDELCLI